MAFVTRTLMILALGTAAGCPGDDSGATSGGQDSAAESSTGASTTNGPTSTSTPTSDGSGGSGDASGSETGTTDATVTGTTAATSTTGDETGTTGAVAGCQGLAEKACLADAACTGMTGQPIVPEANGAGFCYGDPQFLFCIDAGVPCLPATQTVCMGDMVYEAWSQCGLPPGWEACAPPGDVNGDC